MTLRLAAAVVTACLCGSALFAQAPPELTRQQRELLQAVITAVDRSAATPLTPDDHTWLIHVLRASDGAHYVAFSVTPQADALPDKPIMLYVRLATAAPAGATAAVERSVVREWLKGSRIDPRLLPRSRGFAVGEMPPMGAGSIGGRGATSVGSSDLQIMGLERERSREKKADEERQRRAALEGNSQLSPESLPFEDFELGPAAAFGDGTRAIQRALTAGPGAYDLFVGWVDATQPVAKARIHLAHQSLQLGPAAATDFLVSSVIIADQVGVRQTPYSSLEQRAHPYAIGATEIVPARDAVFTPGERLSVAFQIVNPMPSASGKPDVKVNLRIVRAAGAREDTVATLSPLTFDAPSLPADFDLRLGHPIIAALAVPLATIPRGQYRLAITAEDRISSTIVASGATFTVVGTPASLLAEAPALGARFLPAVALQPAIVNELLDRLAPSAASPALTAALKSARSGRFADLLIADVVPATEQAVRTTLSGVALMSLGNPSAMAEFQRALALHAPIAPVQFLLAASRAMQGRDAEAVTSWEAARTAGFPAAMVDGLLAEAYLRLKDYPRAATAIGSPPATGDAAGIRTFAATRIATRREPDAIEALNALVARDDGDLDARWLLVHALYSDFVGGNRDRRDRFHAEAQRYIDAKGPHAALAADWLAQVK